MDCVTCIVPFCNDISQHVHPPLLYRSPHRMTGRCHFYLDGPRPLHYRSDPPLPLRPHHPIGAMRNQNISSSSRCITLSSSPFTITWMRGIFLTKNHRRRRRRQNGRKGRRVIGCKGLVFSTVIATDDNFKLEDHVVLLLNKGMGDGAIPGSCQGSMRGESLVDHDDSVRPTFVRIRATSGGIVETGQNTLLNLLLLLCGDRAIHSADRVISGPVKRGRRRPAEELIDVSEGPCHLSHTIIVSSRSSTEIRIILFMLMSLAHVQYGNSCRILWDGVVCSVFIML
jgi:hypothetical protein